MPCQCDYPSGPSEDSGLRREADAATRASCDMRTIIRKFAPNLMDELTSETLRWIQKHDNEDAKRIAEENAKGIREEVRKKAMSKLSLEERRVLGL